jgi:hypothetical protein
VRRVGTGTFGFRDDRTQDLGYANAWFADRLTAGWLAIG